MAEVTRVPLQPIAKGSLLKLWLGVLAAVVLAALIAFFAQPRGLTVDEIRAGEGPNPAAEDVVFVQYTGRLEDGTVFDQSQGGAWPVPGILPEGAALPLSDMIPGFRDALLQMQKGGVYEVFIPADLAYGDDVPEGAPIPPGADLTFNIELVDFMTREEAEQRYQQMLAAMQAQMTAPEGEEGAAAAPADGAAVPPVQ